MPSPHRNRLWSWVRMPIFVNLLEGLVGMLVYCLLLLFFLPKLQRNYHDLQSEASIFTGLVLGLLMTTRNRLAYDRWWEARGAWGRLVNDSRNLCLKTREFTRCEPEQLNYLRVLVGGFAKALMLHLRDGVTLQQVPGFEQAAARPTHVPMYLAGEIQGVVAEAVRRGQLDAQLARLLEPHMAGFMDVCGNCEKIRNTPVPASFLGLLRLGLMIYFIFGTAFLIDEQGAWVIPIIMVIFFFLAGLELLDTELEEPFGTDGDDLALDTYCQTIAKSVNEVLAQGSGAGDQGSGQSTV